MKHKRMQNARRQIASSAESEGDRYLRGLPRNITLGQRREALRRLFVNRLGWAVHDQACAESFRDAYDTDCWLENAIGETVVRAYALGLVHSNMGTRAEESSPAITIVGFEPLKTVRDMDWEGEPADRRLSDLLIEMLHQELRVALPMRNDSTIIEKVRKYDEQLGAKHNGTPTTTIGPVTLNDQAVGARDAELRMAAVAVTKRPRSHRLSTNLQPEVPRKRTGNSRSNR